jgi:hypothetical protein
VDKRQGVVLQLRNMYHEWGEEERVWVVGVKARGKETVRKTKT